MKRLYIDFDGVVLDTIRVLYEEAERRNVDKNNPDFYINFDYKDILDDKYILNDGINAIDKLINSGKFEVSILTHCHSVNEASDKVNYIRRHFKDMTVIICPKDISKTKMVHTDGAILVDDFAGNLEEWESEGGIPIKFSTKLKGKGFRAIDRLDSLLEIF